jgi:HNH endonuclease
VRGRTNTFNYIKLKYVEIIPNGCWLWKGPLGSEGYGQVHLDKKHWHVHRLFYTMLKGPIIPFRQIHHTCKNKLCVNPDHMTLLSIKGHGTISNFERYKL